MQFYKQDCNIKQKTKALIGFNAQWDIAQLNMNKNWQVIFTYTSMEMQSIIGSSRIHDSGTHTGALARTLAHRTSSREGKIFTHDTDKHVNC